MKVWLNTCPGYDHPGLESTVHDLLGSALGQEVSGSQVLVKPNFISRQNSDLSCTHPAVIRAVSSFFLQTGNRVVIGDSPAFGTVESVAASLGLEAFLEDMPVKLLSFSRGQTKGLPFGRTMLLSRDALQADLIVNVPKLKAHKQMRISGAVKNLFGCVVGLRKAVMHARYGEKGRRFEQALLSILTYLPRTLTLVDGIRTMHDTGPVHGQACDLRLLAAGLSPVAVDTAVYSLLDLRPEQVPLWLESWRQDLPGARRAEILFPGLKPEDFQPHGFRTPADLTPVSFHPVQLIRSSIKRIVSACDRSGFRT